MSWSQSFVVSWAQFSAAVFLFLLATRLALVWIKQPVDRIWLIQLAMLTSVVLPLLMLIAPWPVARLAVFSGPTDAAAIQRSANDSPTSTTPVAPSTRASSRPNEETAAMDLADPVLGRVTKISTEPSFSDLTREASLPRIDSLDRWDWAAILIGLLHGTAFIFSVAEWSMGAYRLRRLVPSGSSPAHDLMDLWHSATQGRGSHVNLIVSQQVDTPFTFGWRRPVVIVPVEISTADRNTLRYCLSHEWSHVQRADILSLLGMSACQFILFHQPLFWRLWRELRVCQDIIADTASTSDHHSAIAYSELLVSFHRNLKRPASEGALAMFHQRSQLTRRVTMLLVRPFQIRTKCSRKFSLGTAMLAAIAAVLMSGIRLENATADDQTSNQEIQASVTPATATDKLDAKSDEPASEERPDNDEEPKKLTAQATDLVYQCSIVDKETGQGISNAKITIDRLDSKGHWPYKSIAKTKHVSDADGKFTVEIPPEQSGHASLYIQVYVEHNDYVHIPGVGYSFDMIRKNETTGERPFFENLTMQPADHITGKVVSPFDEPLVDVTIFGFTSPRERVPHGNGNRWLKTTTGTDGSFRLNVMKGGVTFLWILPNDYSIVQKYVANSSGNLGEIRVPWGIRVSGKVVSTDDQPLAGIALNAYRQDEVDPENMDQSLRSYSVLSGIRRGTITDGEGRFMFDPLPPGQYRIVPENELHDPRHERDVQPLPAVFSAQTITIKTGDVQPVHKFKALPHINFHAQYLDSQGAKRSGHEFFLSGRWNDNFWSTKAQPNAEGTASAILPRGIQNVRAGLITNEHSALRHRKGNGRPIENHVHDVDLGTLNDDVEGFEIIRYKAPIVLIQAVDSEGRQIWHFRAAAKYSFGDKGFILDGGVRSDVSFERQRDGRYRTSQMLPDEEVTFTAAAVGYESSSTTLKLAEGETKELVITLKSDSEVVDTINSAVDGAVNMIQQLNPNATPKND